jgi:hypothetical protein
MNIVHIKSELGYWVWTVLSYRWNQEHSPKFLYLISTQQGFISEKVNLHKQCRENLKSFIWKTVTFSKKDLPQYSLYKFVSFFLTYPPPATRLWTGILRAFEQERQTGEINRRDKQERQTGETNPLQVRRVWFAPHVVTMFPTFVWKWKLKKKNLKSNHNPESVGCLNMCICYGLLVAHTHSVDLTYAVYWQPVTADESLTDVVSVENAIICKRDGLYTHTHTHTHIYI